MFQHARKTLLAAVAFGLLASAALAADTAKITYDGYLDSSYNLDLNAKNGTFGLNQFGLNINAADDSLGIKGVASLVRANYNNTGAGVNVEYIGIDQAYVDKSFFDGMLEAKIGRFYTLVGYEVVPAPKNANETSSLLFNNEPVKHDGLALTYNPLKSLSISGWVANNVEQLYDDSYSYVSFESADSYSKDLGAQASYTLGGLNLIGTYYFEPIKDDWHELAPTDKSVYDQAHVLNFVSSYKASDSLSFAGEYLYRTIIPNSNYSGDYKMGLKDQGYALYSTYTLGQFSVSPRFAQYFYPDDDLYKAHPWWGQYMLDKQVYEQKNQYTLTFKYAFGSLTAYLEGNVYATPEHFTFTNGSSSNIGTQSNILIGASYQF
jgi:hypothetical protein